MIKLANAGLRALGKMSLGFGFHNQKRIRAPVSKMIGLRAPQQKFQGSTDPPLGPCLLMRLLSAQVKIKEKPTKKRTEIKIQSERKHTRFQNISIIVAQILKSHQFRNPTNGSGLRHLVPALSPVLLGARPNLKSPVELIEKMRLSARF